MWKCELYVEPCVHEIQIDRILWRYTPRRFSTRHTSLPRTLQSKNTSRDCGWNKSNTLRPVPYLLGATFDTNTVQPNRGGKSTQHLVGKTSGENNAVFPRTEHTHTRRSLGRFQSSAASGSIQIFAEKYNQTFASHVLDPHVTECWLAGEELPEEKLGEHAYTTRYLPFGALFFSFLCSSYLFGFPYKQAATVHRVEYIFPCCSGYHSRVCLLLEVSFLGAASTIDYPSSCKNDL